MLVVEPTRTDWSSEEARDFDTKAMVDRLKGSTAGDGGAFDDWEAQDGYDSVNDASLTAHYIEYLDRDLAAGVPVFNCEYALDQVNEAYRLAADKGYICYCTRRSLGRLTTTPPPGP